jgi:hypothetical protein
MKFKYLFVLSFILGLSSCESFEELAADPNRATQVNPGLLLTGIEVSAFNRVSDGAALAARYLVFTDGIADEQYYGWQRAGFGGYSNLRQVTKMIEEAERTNLLNYVALGKFFRAYFFHDLTRTFGDIPYSEALKGESENFAPKYDRQEDVYLGILQELEEANAMLNSANGVINGDVIYGGDILNWKKLINSFHVRVLIDLSAKDRQPKSRCEARMRAIVNDPVPTLFLKVMRTTLSSSSSTATATGIRTTITAVCRLHTTSRSPSPTCSRNATTRACSCLPSRNAAQEKTDSPASKASSAPTEV